MTRPPGTSSTSAPSPGATPPPSPSSAAASSPSPIAGPSSPSLPPPPSPLSSLPRVARPAPLVRAVPALRPGPDRGPRRDDPQARRGARPGDRRAGPGQALLPRELPAGRAARPPHEQQELPEELRLEDRPLAPRRRARDV